SAAGSGSAPGESAAGESAPATTTGDSTSSAATPQIAPADPSTSAPSPSSATPRVFRDGPNDVFLHTLHTGVRVIAGTVLGHVGDASGAGAGDEPRIIFEIRP